MDEKKILFIICSNNSIYLNECIWYISKLNIPDGYIVDVVSIEGAESISQGYNEGMRSSNAKYKIYLHQDVFLLNVNIIFELLDVFVKDPKVGMVGVIGGVNLPQNAILWNSWNIGVTYGCNGKQCVLVKGYIPKRNCCLEAEALDGMFLATQYDLEWREDLGLKWDGYDISQSLEYRRKGYKIVVPYQSEAWCFHDCGPSNIGNYDFARRIILNEYRDFFNGEFVETEYEELANLQRECFTLLWNYVKNNQLKKATTILENLEDKALLEKNISLLKNVIEILNYEIENGCTSKLFVDINDSWDEVKNKYEEMKMKLRRIEYNGDEESINILRELQQDGTISFFSLVGIAIHSLTNPDQVLKKIMIH